MQLKLLKCDTYLLLVTCQMYCGVEKWNKVKSIEFFCDRDFLLKKIKHPNKTLKIRLKRVFERHFKITTNRWNACGNGSFQPLNSTCSGKCIRLVCLELPKWATSPGFSPSGLSFIVLDLPLLNPLHLEQAWWNFAHPPLKHIFIGKTVQNPTMFSTMKIYVMCKTCLTV